MIKWLSKYINPKSMTFWLGLFTMLCGVLEFVNTMHSLGIIGTIIAGMFGPIPPFTLVIAGLGTITMRAAMPNLNSLI